VESISEYIYSKNNEAWIQRYKTVSIYGVWTRPSRVRGNPIFKKNQTASIDSEGNFPKKEEDLEEEGDASASCCNVALLHNSIEKRNGCTEQAAKISGESIHHPSQALRGMRQMFSTLPTTILRAEEGYQCACDTR